jgi:hypothetical protein
MDAIERGSLAKKAVLPLLADLYQQGATGSLRLERAPLQKAVYFRDGQILFAASNDPKDQLASILVEEGKLSPDQMQLARARVSAGNPLAKVLTELGYISQRELADAARLKVEKILTDLFTWKEGTYQFAEKSLPKGAIDLELSTQRLLFNSIRRIEDRSWVLEELESLDSVLSPTGSLDAFIVETEPDENTQKVLQAVDGTKTIKQIADSSDLGDFAVSKIVAAGLMIGSFQKGATEPEAASIPADEEAFSVEPADVISFQVAEPGEESDEDPLEQTIVETDASAFSFSPEDSSPPLAPPEQEAPLISSTPEPPLVLSEESALPLVPAEPETQLIVTEPEPPLPAPPESEPPLSFPESEPPLAAQESEPPAASSDSEPPLVYPESQPQLGSLDSEPPPEVSPESQPPLISPESQPPLISPEPTPAPTFQGAGVSGLLIDEPETDVAEETPQRTPPRPRQTESAPEGGIGKKVLVGLAAILLLAVGGLAGYYFIWPMFSSDETASGSETPPATSPSSQQPPSEAAAGRPTPGRPGQTQPKSPANPSTPAPATATATATATSPPTRPGAPRPTPAAPSSTGGSATSSPTPARPTPQPAPTPPPSRPSRPTTGSSTSGQDLLQKGQYPQAARSYLEQLKSAGTNKFTIAVGVYCEASNVGRAFRNSGNSNRLIVIPYQYKSRPCYRVFWGLYDSERAARQDLASVPAAIRSPQSIPVPISRLTR